VNAAVYARKSTEQKVADEAKSVTRQVELARAYAEAKGWTVEDRHVYVDDGISGAAFGEEERPAMAALLVAAERGEFGVVVAMNEDRIGRDDFVQSAVLMSLRDADCKLWYYAEDRNPDLDTALGKFMENVRGFAAEMEREKAGARSREKAQALARAGHVAGNKLFGYSNVRDGAFVRRVKDPVQAPVVARIFALYASGMGDRAIRDLLNGEHVPPPRPPRPWSETTIRDLLTNETYRGVVVWNKTRAAMKKGREVMVPRPESEWIKVEAPDLRIVDEETWAKAQAHRLRRRSIYRRGPKGRITGRTSEEDRRGLLLSGFMSCGVCGSRMWAEAKVRGPRRDRRLVRWWGCGANIARGAAGCSNSPRVLDAWMEHRVLDAVKGALDPAELAETFRAALAQQRAMAEEAGARRERLERELAITEKRVRNILDAIGVGGDLPRLVDDLKAATAREDEIKAQLAGAAAPAGEEETIAAALHRARVALEFLDMGPRDPGRTAAGRSTLRAHLAEPLKCIPVKEDGRSGFKFTGLLAVGGFLIGSTLPASTEGASRWGCPSRPA
jgi:DNA invertase Pin-like site-specific DNA recombinase